MKCQRTQPRLKRALISRCTTGAKAYKEGRWDMRRRLGGSGGVAVLAIWRFGGFELSLSHRMSRRDAYQEATCASAMSVGVPV